MSVNYNSSAIAGTMNAGLSNVTGTTAENVTAPENYNQVVNNGGQYIKNPRDILINNVVGRTSNGLTVSRNSDGSISIAGTATSPTRSIYFYNFAGTSIPSTVTENDYQKIPKGKYIIGSAPNGSEANKYSLSYRYGSTIGGPTRLGRVLPNETNVIDNTNGDYNYIMLYFTVWAGVTVNLTVNPYLKKV